MHKAIKLAFFCALLALGSTIASAHSAGSVIPNSAISQATGKILFQVNANGTAVIGQLASNWNSSYPNGPFVVMLFNQTTGVWAGPFPTNNAFMVFNGLTVGNTYRVHVRDNDSVLLSAPVTL